MAEGNGEKENPYSFRNYARKKESTQNEDSDGSEENSARPDLGIGNQPSFEKKSVADSHGSEHHSSQSGNEIPKREENPFSFKHFLKRDSGNNYLCTGARPKIYNNITPDSFDHAEVEPSDSDAGLYTRTGTPRHVATPELTSVLPDFVQDHLVVEQCYLNHSDGTSTPQIAVDLDNLPDFAINNISTQEPEDGNRSPWDEPKNVVMSDVLPKDIPFDLTGTTSDQNFSRRVRNNSGPVPLDLPSFDRSPADNLGRSGITCGRLPFDLPLVSEVNDLTAPSTSSGVRSGPHLGEVGASKSLPDFLSDGPIHSGRHSDVVENTNNLPGCNSTSGLPRNLLSDEQVQRLQVENERLRRELEVSRRQFADQTRRMQLLEKEVSVMQSKEHEETASLEKAIEQVEDNLKRSTRRAVIAENQVSKLKQETKILLSEVGQLRRENRDLRSGQGPSDISSPNHEQQTQRLAEELRAAAGSAEMSLRQLLNGVGNLRVIASTMESMHRIHDRTTDFLSDLDDDESGPAL